MLKKLSNPWFLGSVAAILFLLAMFGSSSFQECASNCAQSAQDNQDSSSSFFSVLTNILDWTRLSCVGGFIHDAHEEILASFTVLLAFFTLALWASTSQIARDAKTSADKTIETMQDTARKELRAYLGIPDPIVDRLGIGFGNHFQARVTVTNTGRTPAKDVHKWMKCKLVDKGDMIVFDQSEFDPPKRPIAPDSHWHLREDFTKWTDDEIAAITRYEKILYVWGQINYKDIYNDPHTTEFRFRTYARRFGDVESINPMPDGSSRKIVERVTIGWTLEPEPEGNKQT